MSEKSLIEAALFVAGKGVSLKEIEKLTGLESKVVKDIVEQLLQEYSQRDSGILISQSENGFLMRIKPEFEEKLLFLFPEADLPKGVLKTLALIAYEQPIRQTVVVRLRGNRVYHYIHRLIELGFIRSRPEGRTCLLTTTDKFKEYFKIHDVRKETSAIVTVQDSGGRQTTLEIPSEAQEAVDEAIKAEEIESEVNKE